MTLAPGTLVRQAIEQDFKHAYEILPRAITKRWLESVGLSDVVSHSSRLEVLREAFAEEFRSGLLRESDFAADPSFDLDDIPEPAPLVPLDENGIGVLDGIPYECPVSPGKYSVAFIGKLGQDRLGVYSAEKVLMFVWSKGLQKSDLADLFMSIHLGGYYLQFLELMGERTVVAQVTRDAHGECVRPYTTSVEGRLASDRPGYRGQVKTGLTGKVDMIVEGVLLSAGLERFRCFSRFEVLKRETPERFMHCFKAEDIEILLQRWQADLLHILSPMDLSDWSEKATREEKNQVADYFNFFGARRLEGYLEKFNQLPRPTPQLGRSFNLMGAFDFPLSQVHPEVGLGLLERLPP